MLIVAQIALSMVSLIASARRKFRKAQTLDPQHVLVLRLRPELLKYTPQKVDALVRRVHELLRAAPGIQSVGFMEGGEGLVWEWRSGHDAQLSLSAQSPVQTTDLQVRKQDVSPDFLRTLKIPKLKGRAFTEQNRSGSPRVAIINEALARHLWSVGRVVGRTVYVNGQPFQVVGVCAVLQPHSSICAPEPHLYLSYRQSNATREGDIRLAVRVAGDPVLFLPVVRRTIQSIDQYVPVGEDMPMSEQAGLDYLPVLLAPKR